MDQDRVALLLHSALQSWVLAGRLGTRLAVRSGRGKGMVNRSLP